MAKAQCHLKRMIAPVGFTSMPSARTRTLSVQGALAGRKTRALRASPLPKCPSFRVLPTHVFPFRCSGPPFHPSVGQHLVNLSTLQAPAAAGGTIPFSNCFSATAVFQQQREGVPRWLQHNIVKAKPSVRRALY
jgi:hypothetical protein